jgi:hypothetical protein
MVSGPGKEQTDDTGQRVYLVLTYRDENVKQKFDGVVVSN